MKELIEENDKFRMQINALEELTMELKQSAKDRMSVLDDFDDNCGYNTNREASRRLVGLDLSAFNPDLSIFESNKIMDIKKLIPLKNDYPELFAEKLLNNYRILEGKYLNINKEMKKYKNSSKIFEEKYNILSNNYHKLSTDYEKIVLKRKQLEAMLGMGSGSGGGTGTPLYQSTKADPSTENKGSTLKRKRPTAYEALDAIKCMGATGFVGEKASNDQKFQDLSSILISPFDLNNQQNLSSDEEIDKGESILEEIENEDDEDREL
jgi:hypothetical protein